VGLRRRGLSVPNIFRVCGVEGQTPVLETHGWITAGLSQVATMEAQVPQRFRGQGRLVQGSSGAIDCTLILMSEWKTKPSEFL
jgi:hypothetical protein